MTLSSPTARSANGGPQKTGLRGLVQRAPRLGLVTLLALVVELNVIRFIILELIFRVGSDFPLYYVGARLGETLGWSHIYDKAPQRRLLLQISSHSHILPLLNPPPMAWLAAPFALLPYWVAYVLWTVAIAALLAVGFALVLPRRGRIWWSLALASLYPMAYVIFLGQSTAIAIFAVLCSWRLLRDRHEVAAGLVLSLILVKPQIAPLVPLLLLAARRWRPALAWAGATAALAILSVASLGVAGSMSYLHALLGPHRTLDHAYTLASVLRGGDATLAVQGLAVLAGLVVVVLAGRRAPHLPFVVGLLLSLPLASYWHFQDLTVMAAAAAIMASAGSQPGAYWLLAGTVLAGSPLFAATSYISPWLQVAAWFAVDLAYLAYLLLGALGVRAKSPAFHRLRGAVLPQPAE